MQEYFRKADGHVIGRLGALVATPTAKRKNDHGPGTADDDAMRIRCARTKIQTNTNERKMKAAVDGMLVV